MATKNAINSNIPIEISKGGTNNTVGGASYGLIYFNGTSYQNAGAGATGQVLISTTSAAPSFSSTPSVSSITISGTPVSATDGANKAYVDAISSGLSFKSTTLAGSIAPLTATYNNGAAGVGATLTNAGVQAAFAIDGYSASINDRILIKNQANAFENGIYSVTTLGSGASNWQLTRTTDYDTPAKMVEGSLVPVQLGTVNANTLWLQNTIVTLVGTDNVTYQEFQSAPIGIPVSIAQGGTNAISMADNYGTILFNGTSLVTTAPGTSGQLLTSNGPGAVPTYKTLSSFLTWNDVVGTSAAMSVSNAYVSDNGALVTLTLPPIAAFGAIVKVVGKGAGGWFIAQNAGQVVNVGSQSTTVGIGGSISSTNQYDAIELVCVTANTTWCSTGALQGNVNIV